MPLTKGDLEKIKTLNRDNFKGLGDGDTVSLLTGNRVSLIGEGHDERHKEIVSKGFQALRGELKVVKAKGVWYIMAPKNMAGRAEFETMMGEFTQNTIVYKGLNGTKLT